MSITRNTRPLPLSVLWLSCAIILGVASPILAERATPELQWSTTLGGSLIDVVYDIDTLSDGTVLVAGSTSSGDFPAPLGTPPTPTGNDDAFIARLDPSASGPDQLLWTTFIGGDGLDAAYELSHNAMGQIVVVGYTESTDLAVTAGAMQPTISGGSDGFIAVLDGDGAIAWLSYVGGSGADWAVALDSDDTSCVVGGYTTSSDLGATAGSWQPDFAGTRDAFVMRLDLTQLDINPLEWCSYYGGSGEEGLLPTPIGGQAFELDRFAVELAGDGSVVFVGSTLSADLSTTVGAAFPVALGDRDAFIARLAGDGSDLLYASYIGGAGEDQPFEVRVRKGGELVIAGSTTSTDFPTTSGAIQTTSPGGAFNGWVMRLDTAISGTTAIVASTYLGGSGADSIVGLDIDAAGDALVVGNSTGMFPTTAGALVPTYPASSGYVGHMTILDLSADGSSELLYSSFLGAAGGSVLWAARFTDSGAACVAGWTAGDDYPTTPGAYQIGVDYIGAAISQVTFGTVGVELVRGDVNEDSSIDISDAIALLSILFGGATASDCEDALDTNDSGGVDIADAVYLLGVLFVPGSPGIPAPGMSCGVDPSDDALACVAHAACP